MQVRYRLADGIGGRMSRPRDAARPTCIQVRAKASKLEHSSTRLAVVSAKNPPETASWFCMVHLPLSMLVRID